MQFFIWIIHSSLAGLGLIENNASNIVAAMLVSPLMGPVMSITFGIMISDYKLMVSLIEFNIPFETAEQSTNEKSIFKNQSSNDVHRASFGFNCICIVEAF